MNYRKSIINMICIMVMLCIMTACSNSPKPWQIKEVKQIEGVFPIGIAPTASGYIISDGNNNRLLEYDASGALVKEWDGFERPMHIDIADGKIYIPEYGSDIITIIDGDDRSTVAITDSLDAPAGVSVFNNEMAIADFYNHRILYKDETGKWSSFGEEGRGPNQFYYPTDVQITEDRIYVADAYNNRVQVFNKSGEMELIFGFDEDMNATTGILVLDDQVLATDFENGRVLSYDHEGNLLQIIDQDLPSPIDIAKVGEELYVINFEGERITVLE